MYYPLFGDLPVASILYVEDDLGLAHVVSRWLEKRGHMVTHLDTCQEALEYLRYTNFDLAIFDWELPDRSGAELLREYRRHGGMIPVMMLTQRSKVEDKLDGFSAGADDYLTKPFDGREFMMRVQALLNRPRTMLPKHLKLLDLVLDIESRTAIRGETVVSLSKRESLLLEMLMKRPDQMIPSDSILNTVWSDPDDGGTVDALTTCIGRLRKKIDVAGQKSMIRNVHGLGYGIFSS